MNLYHADPARHLRTAVQDLDDLDRDLSDLSVRRVQCSPRSGSDVYRIVRLNTMNRLRFTALLNTWYTVPRGSQTVAPATFRRRINSYIIWDQ